MNQILQDTAWKAGQTINLTGDVQIDNGVTLVVEPGAIIKGNGFKIQAYGILDINGTSDQHVSIDNVDFEFGTTPSKPGRFDISYADINGGKFLSSSGYGSFNVEQSTFSSVSGFYIWYPTSPSYFKNNIFFKSSGLSIGTSDSGTLLVQNNLFAEQTTNYAIESWANYNNGINVNRNSFISTDRVALAIRDGYDKAKINSTYNYFGTSDLSAVSAMILDRNDSLTRASVIDTTSIVTEPDSETPVFKLNYVPNLLTESPVKPLIILNNSVWKAGQTINLTGDVQIDNGVTLVVEPGAIIKGNGFKIQAYGILDINGTSDQHVSIDNVDFEFGTTPSKPGRFDISYADINGGKFLSSSGYGSFNVEQSTFSSVSGFYIWYPTSPSYFKNNIFFKSSGLSIGTSDSGTLLVQNNLFAEQTTNYAIESWANYNNGINVNRNSFISTDRVALAIRDGYDKAKINSTYNYFGTSDLSAVSAMILDRNDSLTRASVIDTTSIVTEPDSETPVFKLNYVPNLLTESPVKPLIILNNSVWKAGQTINLTGDVQIDNGVTLVVEPGAIIKGNGFKIQAYGILDINGTSDQHVSIDNVDFEFGTTPSKPGRFDISYADINGGKFLSSSGYGSFNVEQSTFSSVSGFYIWYPTSPSYFKNNIFFKSSGLSIGTSDSGTLLVQNNLFAEQTTNYAIESWANYNNGINVNRNSFISTDRVALAIRDGYDKAKINSTYNYFGTSDLSAVSAMILDRNDSLTRASVIDTTSIVTEPDSETPVPITYNLTVTTKTWKGFSLSGVKFSEDNKNETSNDGIINPIIPDLDMIPGGIQKLIPSLESDKVKINSAINLTDVLAALKIYLGKSLPDAYASPFNYIAADFDGNGSVNLTDVLSLLKFYLGKTTTATPSWVFVDAADVIGAGKTASILRAGSDSLPIDATHTQPHVIDQDFSKDSSIELVGILRGDVDGSWNGQ